MKLRSFSPAGNQVAVLCSELAAFLLRKGHHPYAESELVIITPETSLEKGHLTTSSVLIWAEIQKAWQQIEQSKSGGGLANWRLIHRYGKEIAPGLGVFRLRESKAPVYFYLVSQRDPFKAAARLRHMFFSLSIWDHIDQGRCVFHAAGVVHMGFAYLFAGASGAGKSTVGSLSNALGYTIIHDDHVVVYPDQAGNYLVADISPSTSGVPLKSIFFLVQGSKDRLVPLSALDATRGLFDGFLDIVSENILSDQMLRYAFAFSADIARRVPGYELHFRKSPEFWKLIKEQFPA